MGSLITILVFVFGMFSFSFFFSPISFVVCILNSQVNQDTVLFCATTPQIIDTQQKGWRFKMKWRVEIFSILIVKLYYELATRTNAKQGLSVFNFVVPINLHLKY